MLYASFVSVSHYCNCSNCSHGLYWRLSTASTVAVPVYRLLQFLLRIVCYDSSSMVTNHRLACILHTNRRRTILGETLFEIAAGMAKRGSFEVLQFGRLLNRLGNTCRPKFRNAEFSKSNLVCICSISTSPNVSGALEIHTDLLFDQQETSDTKLNLIRAAF